MIMKVSYNSILIKSPTTLRFKGGQTDVSDPVTQANLQNFEIIPSEDGYWSLTLDGFTTPQDAMMFCNNIDEAIQIKKDWDAACKEAGE